MKIAICDDDSTELVRVRKAAADYAAGHRDRSFVFDCFSHPEDLLEAAEKCGGYDIYILDIVMPDMSGIALAEKLRSEGYGGKIIYLSSSDEYYPDAFRVRALDYMLKPLRAESFAKALDDAAAQIAVKKDRFLLVKSRERTVKLSYDSILYAEFENRALSYHLADGSSVVSTTLRTTFAEAVSELLRDERFTLSGQSMALNLDHVIAIEHEAVVFTGGLRHFMGEKLCRRLRIIWSNYLFEGKSL